MLEDVTVQKESAYESRRLLDELVHVSRVNTMAEMATGIAHELNQPLCAIAIVATSCIAGLSDKNPDPAIILERLNHLRDMAHQASDIISGLQNFVRRQPQRQERTTIGTLVDRTVEMLHYELQKAETRLQYLGGDHAVCVDPVQIQQVLVNLIRNAIAATTAGSQSPRSITISTTVNDDVLEVCVCDNGTGIPSELIDRLFEPFVSSKSDGIGIGLAISTRIVTSHGGTLEASNNPQHGATFRFTLPLDVHPQQLQPADRHE